MKTALIVLGVLLLLGVAAMAAFVFIVQNVEQPAYRVVKQDGVFEIRDYPALVVAEVRRQGPRREALSAGFGPLAGYIFAKERTGDRISMTAPVTQQRKNTTPLSLPETAPVDADEWTVGFIMPAQYRLDQLPTPAGGEVHLREVPPRRAAAIRFKGRADDALMASKEIDLRAWMASHRLTPAGTAVFAYYNDPLTPGPLRRNEVLIDVAAPTVGARP